MCLSCSIFARIIVALLVEAQELKHLWVFADNQPRAAREHWKAEYGQHSEPNEENRHTYERDRHPR